MIGPKVLAMNENAVANIATDMTFLEGEITRIERGHLNSSFTELQSVCIVTPRCLLVLTMAADGQDHPYRHSAGLSEREYSTSILQRSQAKKAPSTLGEACQIRCHAARQSFRERRETQKGGRDIT